MLTQASVRELLHYDPETGALTWLSRGRKWFETDDAWNGWNVQHAGKPAGSANTRGYIKIRILRGYYRAHRVIWLYQTGSWPPPIMDHVNRDPSDNRWANLRTATDAENQWNTTARKANTSGFKGVFRQDNKWRAQIKVDGKKIHLGLFVTPEGASLAYRWAAERYHREFAGGANV